MINPLDYTFLIIIALTACYGVHCFWYAFLRVDENTTDDLIERYVELERHEHR